MSIVVIVLIFSETRDSINPTLGLNHGSFQIPLSKINKITLLIAGPKGAISLISTYLKHLIYFYLV